MVENVATMLKNAEDKNFLVDEDEEENKSFSDNNEEITSPDLDKPNCNEIKEFKTSSIKDTYYLTL